MPSRLRILPLLLLLLLAACADDVEPEAEMPDDLAETAEAGDDLPAPDAIARVDINTATEEQMRAIPDVDSRMVHEFEEYRPYTSIEDFRREIGKYVDAAQVAAYERYVFVPIRPNQSDLETLQQIPGLDASEAQSLIDGRPYASRAAFLDALGSYVSDVERATAEQYVALD